MWEVDYDYLISRFDSKKMMATAEWTLSLPLPFHRHESLPRSDKVGRCQQSDDFGYHLEARHHANSVRVEHRRSSTRHKCIC